MTRVYEYSDYRTYLKDRFELGKQRNPRWTLAAWAKRLRLKSSSTLIMILKGVRNPSPKLIRALSRDLQLKASEAEYFEDLVRLQKLKDDPRLVVLLMEKLGRRHPSGEFRLLDQGTFSAVSHWYYYAIREMVDLDDFREDVEWIQRKLLFKVTPKQIGEAIATLLKLDLLKRDEHGFLRYSGGGIETTYDVHDEGIKRFHEQTLENAKLAIRSVALEDREITGAAFSFKQEDLPKAKEVIRRMQKELLALATPAQADSVYQFEAMFFPLTRSKSKGTES